MINEIGIAVISLIFLSYIYLARKIVKKELESPLSHTVEIKPLQEINPKEKPPCFGFLASQPDDFEIKSSPHPCQTCEWITECVKQNA